METYIFIVHNDPTDRAVSDVMEAWDAYINGLIETGNFVGGGPMGDGCTRGPSDTVSKQFDANLCGYFVVNAASLEAATAMLDDCPTIQGGGTVEVRHVPRV